MQREIASRRPLCLSDETPQKAHADFSWRFYCDRGASASIKMLRARNKLAHVVADIQNTPSYNSLECKSPHLYYAPQLNNNCFMSMAIYICCFIIHAAKVPFGRRCECDQIKVE